MHEHNKECEHKNVKYCHHCRVVYCEKCGKEWHEYGWIYSYPTYPYPRTNPTWIVSYGDNSNNYTKDPNVVENTRTCNHHES